MKTDLNHHYKEREPEETINIITNFFETNGYEIEKDVEMSSVSGTFGYALKLRYNGIQVGVSCGKGVTKEYAYASALGEMYERFCNNTYFFGNPMLLKIVLDNHKNKHGYYYDKDEKYVNNLIDYLDPNMLDYFSDIAEKDMVFLEEFLSYINNNKKVIIPFKNIFVNDDITYVNPMTLFYFQGTNGMVAGNTFEEALNQGISELIERSGLHKLLDNEHHPTLFQLNENNFPDNLKQLVDNIKKDNNDFYIFDLSYNINLPVLISVLINKNTKRISVDAGSFPVFDIALERVITEIYQNTKTFSEHKGKLRRPFKDVEDYNHFIHQTFQGPVQYTFPETLLHNIKIVDTYNKDVFLSSSLPYDNNTILSYYKKLIEDNNINIYCYDNSFISEVKALYLYSPELSKDVAGFRGTFSNMSEIDESLPLKIKKDGFNFAKKLLFYLYSYLQTGVIDPFLLSSGEVCNDEELSAIINFYFFNQIPIYPMNRLSYMYICKIIYAVLTGNLNIVLSDEDIISIATTSQLYNTNELIKYFTLLRYVLSEKYSYEEVKTFFEYFSDEITKEDYDNIIHSEYLFIKTFLEPFKKMYSIENLINIFKPFIDKK